jgi:hypothetical protein
MSRYTNSTTQKLKDGRIVYKTRLYRRIPKSDQDLYIAIQTGDRLDSIANEYLGDSSLWYIIAAANNIHDPSFTLDDGTVLRIPVSFRNYINL